MAWTQADVDEMRAALKRLLMGAAVQTVSYNGPPARTVAYHPADIDALRAELAQAEATLARSSGAKPYRVAKTSKGL